MKNTKEPKNPIADSVLDGATNKSFFYESAESEVTYPDANDNCYKTNSSSSSNNNNNTTSDTQQEPGERTLEKHPDIDGGWSYVIAIVVFFAAFIQDGPKNCFGILLPNLEDDLGSSKTVTSFSAGLLDGTWLAFSLVTAKLVKRFGCRPVAFLGGVVSCVSFFLATFSPNIEIFITFYGVLAGIGIGLFNLPTITLVNIYFREKRGLVLGFVTSGTGVGLLTMSIVVERLIELYGWRGAYMIVAGFYLQICVCASLMRPLSPYPSAEITVDVELDKEKVDESAKNDKSQLNHIEKGHTPINNTYSHHNKEHINGTSLQSIDISFPSSNANSKATQTLPVVVFEIDNSKLLPDYKLNSSNNNISDYRDKDIDKKDSTRSILKEPCFLLFCITAFFIQLTNNIATNFYPSYAEDDMGVDSADAAKIVTAFAISNTIGRFLAGLLSHWGLSNLLIYSAGTTLTGVLYFLIPFYTTYESLLASAAGQAFFIGVFPPLQSVILVELLGLERLPYTMGVMSLCKSVGSVAGPSLSAYLYQASNGYTLPFMFAGCILIIANMLHVLLAILRRKNSKLSH